MRIFCRSGLDKYAFKLSLPVEVNLIPEAILSLNICIFMKARNVKNMNT